MISFGGVPGAHRVELDIPFLSLIISANLAFVEEPYWHHQAGPYRHNQIAAIEIVDGELARNLSLTIGPLLINITWPLPDL
jgi:hypothetical protein